MKISRSRGAAVSSALVTFSSTLRPATAPAPLAVSTCAISILPGRDLSAIDCG